MDRAIPFINKLCQQKSIERNMMVHQNNLSNIRGLTDKDLPDSIDILNRPRGKPCQIEERLFEIERENR